MKDSIRFAVNTDSWQAGRPGGAIVTCAIPAINKALPPACDMAIHAIMFYMMEEGMNIEVINDNMQPFLLGFAKKRYGKGSGYEYAICHEGNPSSGKKEDAHNNLIPNPSSMWVLHEGNGCAKCHDSSGSITALMGKPLSNPVGGELLSASSYSVEPSGVLGIDYTYRMSMSLHSLMTGIASKTLSSNGVIPKRTFSYANFDMSDTDGPVPRVGSEKYKAWVDRAGKSGFLRMLDKVDEIPEYTKGVSLFGSEEKAGFSDIYRKQCARCHVWGEGRNERGDLRASGCAACHVVYGNDGKYEDGDPNIQNTGSRSHPLRHRITSAIPAAQCTHRHTRGRRIGTTFVGMFEYDYVKDGHAPPFNESGKPQEIPLLKEITSHNSFKTQQGKVAMSTIHQHIEKLECYACHATWAPQCFGCHMQYDRRVKGTDWIGTSKKVNTITGRQTITEDFGDLSLENRSFMRWESPMLGINVRGKVSPLTPGCQVFYTFRDEKGEMKALNKHYTTSTGHNSPTLAPINPHATSLVARTCEDCHTNPKSLGYGTGNSRSAGKLLGDQPLFQNLSKGVYGDIPGASTGRWQTPRIEDFPYALDQLMVRSGTQIQNMPLPEDAPLHQDMRNIVEREGLCIGCHQHYGTPEWEALVKKYGKAETAEQHEKMVSGAIKSFMEKVVKGKE